MGKFTKRFTNEQEDVLLSLYVTAPHENCFGVYDTLTQEQFATLGAAFSRTLGSFQERLLKAIEAGDITPPQLRSEFLHGAQPNELLQIGLDLGFDASSVNTILSGYDAFVKTTFDDAFARGDLAIEFASPTRVREAYNSFIENWRVPGDRARKFIQTWAQKYGHNSIKEMGVVRFVVEGIPDLSGKIITGHPLAHPQVASSRYVDWDNVLHLAEQNSDIIALPNAQDVIFGMRRTSDDYRRLTEVLNNHVQSHPDNLACLEGMLQNLSGAEREKAESSFRADAKKSIFDYSRYALFPAVPVSMACQMDCRALEDVLTVFLSSALQNERDWGQKLWAETRKVAPVLLGEKAHVARSDYLVNLREEFRGQLPKLFDFEARGEYAVDDRVVFYDDVPMGTDAQIAAAIAWPYGHGSFKQFHDAITQDPKIAENIFDIVKANRGRWDPLPEGSLHGGLMFETAIDYGADRDNHRHRRGSFSRQLLTTAHGFETPDLVASIPQAQTIYEDLMQRSNILFEETAQHSVDAAQYVTNYGHRCRRLLTWTPGQQGYYVELRGKETGHDSYRDVAWRIHDHLAQKSPVFASLVSVDRESYPQHLAKGARGYYAKHIRGNSNE